MRVLLWQKKKVSKSWNIFHSQLKARIFRFYSSFSFCFFWLFNSWINYLTKHMLQPCNEQSGPDHEPMMDWGENFISVWDLTDTTNVSLLRNLKQTRLQTQGVKWDFYWLFTAWARSELGSQSVFLRNAKLRGSFHWFLRVGVMSFRMLIYLSVPSLFLIIPTRQWPVFFF